MAELPESSSLKSGDYTHFVAIDFGTAGTGCAYSTFVKVNQPEIRTYERWPGLIPGTCKTPTVLLLDPDEKFKAFGKYALDTYYSLNKSEPKRVGDYYLFRQFKMTLYSLQVTNYVHYEWKDQRKILCYKCDVRSSYIHV